MQYFADAIDAPAPSRALAFPGVTRICITSVDFQEREELDPVMRD
jgi:hypothetical protein